MRKTLSTLAIAAALAAGASGAAMAQSYGGYACPAGYVYSAGVCQPGGYGYAPSNPVSGAAASFSLAKPMKVLTWSGVMGGLRR